MRTTQPLLFKTYAIVVALSAGLGLNFLFLTPTFMPLDIPEMAIGLALLGCSLGMLALLILDTHRHWLRFSMAVTVAVYWFWAGVLTIDFFRLSQTSMQLPIAYMGLAAFALASLLVPLTGRDK